MVQAFREVWKRLYVSGSACPDIQLVDVLRVMVDVASGYKRGQAPDAWVLAFVEIMGETTVLDVQLIWQDVAFDRFRLDIDKLEEAEIAANQAALGAIDRLVGEGKLQREAQKLTFP